MENLTSTQKQGSNFGLKSDSLYDAIREKICLLEYQPGMALREEALAAEFNVSRTPIRRVLQRLEHEGLVTHNQGAGVIVTTIDLKQLKDVYELRLKLAEFIGDMMMSRIPEEVLDDLEAIQQDCIAMRNHYNVTEIGRLYHHFHEVMLSTISNRPLQSISDQLFHQTARVWLDILPELDWQQEVDIMHKEISDVLQYLKAGDVKMAAMVRRNHMSMLLQRLNRYLSSADK